MKKKNCMLLMVMLTVCVGMSAQQLAFPEAQGWGRFATGGRTGKVYHVTNLNDSGTGSLRDAVSQANRIIVFDVAGVINLSSRLVFKNNLYVAGQTAPGEGITVYGNGVSFSGASNIIVRHMRFRMGHKGDSGKDAAGIANGANMIFDHCSFSWGLDETFSINPDGKGTTPENITLQNCVIGQGLMTHSAGGLMQADYISLVGNFYCDNSTRNNKIKGINQYANNIVYNWSNGAYIMGGDSEGSSYVNIQSNLFINGPAKGGAAFTGGNADFHCYGVDNWQDNNMNGVFDPFEITDYNAATRVDTPYDYPTLKLNPGKTLLETNLPTVGATLPYRDMADCYMVDEVLSYGKSGALISNEETLVYGAPNTWKVYAGVKKQDTDGDGMPDEWEIDHMTDPNKDDAMVISDTGYTNIENYINDITVEDRDFFLRTPVGLTMDKATTQTLAISWRDYTYDEDGFIIELKKDGDFAEVARTKANTKSYTIANLEPGIKYTVRVRAFKGSDQFSEYTAETAMSTRPLEADLVDIDSYQPDYTWTGGDYDKSLAEGKNVLLAPAADATLTLSETTSPAAVVYNEPVNLTVSGTGAISGAASVNKGAAGVLTLNTTNSYTGATVVHDGVLEFNSLKNGGEASAIGSSVEFAQNWVFDGGTYCYTGGATTTNRSAKLSQTSTFDVKSATVTMNGVIEGADAGSDFIIDGGGQITVATNKFFGYKGATILKGSTLYLSTADISKTGIGSSSKLVMAGGHLKTKGESSGYETYVFPIEVTENTTSQFSPNRNCYINSKVSGKGTIQLNIPYLREYVQGDWSEFSGRLIANGKSSDKRGSLLLLDKTPKLDNTIIELQGNTNLCYWSTTGNLTLGGLSGTSTTYLNGSSKQTDNFKCTWTVGSANSDETFAGKINNWSCSGSGHSGTVNIVKTGTGLWRLTGANDYKGTTTVNSGMLVVNGNNSGTGAVTVAQDAILAGKGSIAGAVTINGGGILQVGDTLASDKGLTFKGNVTLKDGAILQLNNAMMAATYQKGKTIQVFTLSGSTVSGTFSEIVPATPGAGQTWDTSKLYTDGILTVVGDATAISALPADSKTLREEYFTLSGKRVATPAKGVYILRTTTENGQATSRKVVR
jgi:autotransporter-associated beta strand protein